MAGHPTATSSPTRERTRTRRRPRTVSASADLNVDPIAAPIVERIFAEYIAGAGIGTIAEGLNRDGIPSPAATTRRATVTVPAANGAWGKSAVRAILRKPALHRPRGLEPPAARRGAARRGRRGRGLSEPHAVERPREWVWSTEQTHEAIVSPETFAAASAQRTVGHNRRAVTKPRRKRTYCLSSLVFCGECGRRMARLVEPRRGYYRCTFPTEYAGATGSTRARSTCASPT